jgi:hypothetical protein
LNDLGQIKKLGLNFDCINNLGSNFTSSEVVLISIMGEIIKPSWYCRIVVRIQRKKSMK